MKPTIEDRSADLAGALACNGVDATTGEYLWPAVDIAQLARVASGRALEGPELADLQQRSRGALQASFPVVEGVDPDDIAEAGWACVFPALTDDAESRARQDAIREALAPLLSLRRAQATAAAGLYHEYTGERGYRRGETKQQ